MFLKLTAVGRNTCATLACNANDATTIFPVTLVTLILNFCSAFAKMKYVVNNKYHRRVLMIFNHYHNVVSKLKSKLLLMLLVQGNK